MNKLFAYTAAAIGSLVALALAFAFAVFKDAFLLLLPALVGYLIYGYLGYQPELDFVHAYATLYLARLVLRSAK